AAGAGVLAGAGRSGRVPRRRGSGGWRAGGRGGGWGGPGARCPSGWVAQPGHVTEAALPVRFVDWFPVDTVESSSTVKPGRAVRPAAATEAGAPVARLRLATIVGRPPGVIRRG